MIFLGLVFPCFFFFFSSKTENLFLRPNPAAATSIIQLSQSGNSLVNNNIHDNGSSSNVVNVFVEVIFKLFFFPQISLGSEK